MLVVVTNAGVCWVSYVCVRQSSCRGKRGQLYLYSSSLALSRQAHAWRIVAVANCAASRSLSHGAAYFISFIYTCAHSGEYIFIFIYVFLYSCAECVAPMVRVSLYTPPERSDETPTRTCALLLSQ